MNNFEFLLAVCGCIMVVCITAIAVAFTISLLQDIIKDYILPKK